MNRLLLFLHPARLIAAAIGTAAVVAAASATMALAAHFHLGQARLAMVLGGIVALNTMLFFPPGTLGRHPARFFPVLAGNLVPLVATAILARHDPRIVQLLLVAAAGLAALVRAFGPIPTAFATTFVMGMLISLLLGSAPRFPGVAALAALLGSGAGFAADALTEIPFGGLGRRAEQSLLSATIGAFLANAAHRWRQTGGWTATWFAADARHLTLVAEDLAPGPGTPGPILLEHLIGAIGRAGSRLAAVREALGPNLSATIGETFAALASAVRSGAGSEPVLDRLRAAALADGRLGAAGERAAQQALGLWLLLAELARNTLTPTRPPALPRRTLATGPDLGASEYRIALQAVAAVAIAILATHVLPARRPYWIPLTAVILTSTSFGETIRKSYERLLGTVVGLIVGELLWLVLARRPAATTAILVLAVAAIFSSRTAAYRWLLAWVTLALVVLLNEAGEASLLVDGRLVDTMIGVAIVLAVTRFFLPVRAARIAGERTRAMLGVLAAGLEDLLAGRRDEGRPGEIAAALGSLQIISDAELLETALKSGARERVRQRLAAAERITGAFLSFAALPPDFRPAPETRTALAAAAAMARQASAGENTVAPDIAGSGQALLARVDGSGRFRLDLRMLSLVAVLAGAISLLARTIPARSDAAP